MIHIYKSSHYGDVYDPEINHFSGREWVKHDEVVVKTKRVFGNDYTYAEPAAQEGHYAFGGNILFTSNGIFPQFTTPIKLHDRRMWLEGGNNG